MAQKCVVCNVMCVNDELVTDIDDRCNYNAEGLSASALSLSLSSDNAHKLTNEYHCACLSEVLL